MTAKTQTRSPASTATAASRAASLHVVPEGGLANRLRVVASAWAFAEDTGVPMRVHWMRTRDFNASFGRLFEPDTTAFQVSEWGGGRMHKLVERTVEKLVPVAGVAVWVDARTATNAFDTSAFRHAVTRGPLLLRTNYPLGRGGRELLGRFVPVPRLRGMIDAQVGDAQAMVGVHVRRGDHVKATERSTLEGFIAAMQAEVDARADTRFFVATDDPASLAALQARFGGRVHHYPKRALSRDDPRALEDAVVDLFTLARSRKLLGSYWSSFSDMASHMGGQPYHVVGGDG